MKTVLQDFANLVIKHSSYNVLRLSNLVFSDLTLENVVIEIMVLFHHLFDTRLTVSYHLTWFFALVLHPCALFIALPSYVFLFLCTCTRMENFALTTALYHHGYNQCRFDANVDDN